MPLKHHHQHNQIWHSHQHRSKNPSLPPINKLNLKTHYQSTNLLPLIGREGWERKGRSLRECLWEREREREREMIWVCNFVYVFNVKSFQIERHENVLQHNGWDSKTPQIAILATHPLKLCFIRVCVAKTF